MLHVLNDLEKTRIEAEQVLIEGVALRWPLVLTYNLVRFMLKERGVPVPVDLLAWISKGKASDAHVTNWHSVYGT